MADGPNEVVTPARACVRLLLEYVEAVERSADDWATRDRGEILGDAATFGDGVFLGLAMVLEALHLSNVVLAALTRRGVGAEDRKRRDKLRDALRVVRDA